MVIYLGGMGMGDYNQFPGGLVTLCLVLIRWRQCNVRNMEDL